MILALILMVAGMWLQMLSLRLKGRTGMACAGLAGGVFGFGLVLAFHSA
jgi:hypothetical protein